MFYIKKEKEPDSLMEYKKTPNAYYDGIPNKDDIRISLLKEQGYLCGYCMRRISVTSCTIEHYFSQKKHDAAKSLDYRNMLGVCTFNRNCKEKSQTCDAHRNDIPLTVNPWDECSILLISYEEDTGNIYSCDDRINNDWNVVLNLNCLDAHLPANRKAALDALKQYLRKIHKRGLWSEYFLSKIKQSYSEKDSLGQYREYIGIVLWYLDKRIKKK